MRDNRLTAGANTTSYAYDPDNDLQSTTLPNGVLTSATYNTLDRLTQLTSTKSATLADYNYTILGAAGERKQVVELSGRQVDYGYDTAYRLTSETISVATPAGAIGVTYDHTGDRLSRTSTIGVIPAASATYDANDRQAGITYDNNGNTTPASGVTYGYDFLNRLTSATGGIALTYDGDGNRVQETVSGTTTNFLVDENNPTGVPQVVEELVGGVVQRQYTYGHALISENQAAGVSFYGMDASHNVRFLTNTSGAITDQYTYDAFGSLISSGTTPNSYRFAGEHLDANLGLYYLRARYYNAGTGRFWSRDSAELNPDDPRELNRYVYTADNPVNATDPTGHDLVGFGLTTSEETGEIASLSAIGDEEIAREALEKGTQYAWRAKYLAQLLRASLKLKGLSGALMGGVTIAVSEIEGEGEVISINGDAPQQAIETMRELVGDNLIADPFLELHAEASIFERALTIANRAGEPVRNVIQAIGIANRWGPCGPDQQNCMALFEDIGYIPVYFLGRILSHL